MKLPKIKNLLNDENKIKMIGLLTILIGLWLVLYFIPEVFVSLFNTLLGNLILIISVLLVFMNNRVYGIITGIILLLLLRFSQLSRTKTSINEGFSLNVNGTFSINENGQNQSNGENNVTNGNFTQDSETNFLLMQNTINRQKIFDMNTIGTQATQEELDYFNKNGMWPWSQKVIDLYKDAVAKNPYIRTDPSDAANYVRTIYNESAIIQLLTYQTKEGQFLLNGVLIKDPSGNKMEDLPSGFGNFPYESGLMGNRSDDIIKCNLKSDSSIPTLERITYTGKGGIFNEQTQKVTQVDYNDLEKIIPGFTFLNSPCNPCGSMAATPDYSCAYRLKVKGKTPFISSIWQYLWGINDNPLESQPSFLTETIDSNEFPLLSQLQTELQKENSSENSSSS